MLLDHRVAELGAVHLFVAVTRAGEVDDHAARPGQRRIDEAPRADLFHALGLRADTQPEADAAAVAAGRTQRQAGEIVRRMLADHLAVEDEATGAEQHTTPGADQIALGVLLLDTLQIPAQPLGQRRCIGMDRRRPATQARMLARGGTARRQAPGFDADHCTSSVQHQPAHFALGVQAHPMVQRGRPQRGEQRGAGHARTLGAVATRRRWRQPGVGRHGFVAGVVQVVAVTRVGSLQRRHAGFVARTVALQPSQLLDAAHAEIAQGFRPHGLADFLAQVGEHGFDTVVVAGLLLVRRTATGIHHTAAARRGAATGEAVQRQHRQATLAGLQRGAGARTAEADHQQVAFRVPGQAITGAEAQRLQRQCVRHGDQPAAQICCGCTEAAVV
ncbi:hypothetical protein D9M71_259330 [compost metagenome]